MVSAITRRFIVINMTDRNQQDKIIEMAEKKQFIPGQKYNMEEPFMFRYPITSIQMIQS